MNKKSLQKIEIIKKQYEQEGEMTLRRCYYVLVSKHLIPNSKSSYILLSKLFKKARIEGLLPYECIVDTTRNIYRRTTYSSFQEAFEKLCERFRKDSLQEQDVYVEVWIEKEAISNLLYPITYSLDIPLVVSKGFTSVTFKQEASDRFNQAEEEGKKVIVLFVSDFDAEGEYIPKVLKNDLLNNHKCYASFEVKKVLLNSEDVTTYSLISNVDYKISSKQREKCYVKDFINKYGVVQYELDALPSDVLKEKVKQAIEQLVDVSISENSNKLSECEVKEWKNKNLKEGCQSEKVRS